MKLIPAGDLNQAEPVLAIRWCLTRAETEYLKKQKAENIHILFVIAYEGTDLEDRQLVPIDQVMTYLNFRRPGNNTVLAKVVWSSHAEKGAGYLAKRLLSKAHVRMYENRVLNRVHTTFEDTEWLEEFHHVRSMEGAEDFEVVIPKEHFPKEPPEWVKKVVNAGFSYPPIDQCAFRRRLGILPVKLLAFGIWTVITTFIRATIALCLGLCGMRHIDFGAVLRPWEDDIEDVYFSVDRRDSWFNRTGEGLPRSPLMYLFHPMIYLTLFSSLTSLKFFYDRTYLETIRIIWVMVAEFVPMVLGVLIGLAIWGFISRLISKANKNKHDQENSLEFQELLRREKEQSYDELYKLLACRPNLSPAVSALPAQRQTFYLRFLDLKARVCRPYAAN